MNRFTALSAYSHLTKLLAQLALLIIIWCFGNWLQKWLHLPVSAGVIGLFLLLLGLLSGVFKLQWIKTGSDFILAELVLFFIPCVVGLVKYKNLFLTQGWQMVAAVVAGTLCVMAVTAYIVYLGFKFENFIKRKEIKSVRSHHHATEEN